MQVTKLIAVEERDVAQVELVRGYVFGEEPDSPLDRRLVVLEESEGAAALTEDRLKAVAQAWSDMARAWSDIRDRVAKEEPDSPLDRRLVVLEESEGAAALTEDRLKAVAQAWSDMARASPGLRDRVARPALLVSSDDEEELQAVQALVVLLQGRLEARGAAELERLIDVAMPAVSGRPHPAVLDQARRNADFRAGFLARYDVLDAGQVHDLYGSKADNSAALAGRWRHAGRIFGVERQGRILYPAFQFDDIGKPKPVVARVLEALGKRGSWQVASWFTAPNGWLPDDRRPVDVIDTDPDAVAAAAREVTRSNLF